MPFALFYRPNQRLRLAFRLLLASGLPVAATAQGFKPGKAERRELKNEEASASSDRPARADAPASQDPQARMMSKLRDQLEVTDDAEWELLTVRIAKVVELRRGATAGGAGSRGIGYSPDKNKRNADTGGNSEQAALRAAVSDKLPDAEIKARLARVHELYLQEAAKLAKAQEELRAVLTIRQEAVAVMAGLLLP